MAGGGTEIERKYLLDAGAADLGAATRVQAIEQGYLPSGDRLTVRLRRIDGSRAVLTLKAGSGLVRAEEELDLEPDAFKRLWPLTEGARVVKTRHDLRLADGLTAEVDVYHGHLDGLLTVEVEFADAAAAEAFTAPAWFGRDVTGESGYSNRALAG